jgi:orotate phosphoribosyltransferase
VSKESLGADIVAAALLHGDFRLRSGQHSARYFDKYRFESDPVLLRRIAQRMLELVPAGTEVLAGLELGGIPIATAMSLESGLPLVFVRKEAKEYGTCKAVEGVQIEGRKVLLVEDVITTGGAVAEAAGQVRSIGAHVEAVVCAIWRGEGQPSISGLPDLAVLPALDFSDLV